MSPLIRHGVIHGVLDSVRRVDMDSNVPVGLATTTPQSSGRDDAQEPMWKTAQVGPQVDPDHPDNGQRIIPRD